MNTADFINAVMAKRNIESAYALGKALKVSKQQASKYLHGEAIPGPVVAFRVAEILGDQPAAVIAVFEAERAERDGKADEGDETGATSTWSARCASWKRGRRGARRSPGPRPMSRITGRLGWWCRCTWRKKARLVAGLTLERRNGDRGVTCAWL